LWGVKEAIIRPGQRTILKGSNGCGKSSILRAVQLALEGGTLGKYQRVGASPEEQPEIILEISGPKDFIRIERVGDRPPKVLRRVGDSEALESVPAPATFLKGLFDVKGANPFAFLQASDDDRAQLLLEALDIRMDEAALEELLGEDAPLASAIPRNLHALVRLALIHDAVYSARRGCNVDADGKLKAAEQLKRSVPHERAQDATEEIAGLEARVVADAAGLARGEEANDAALARATDDAHHDAVREEGELTRKAGAKILAAKVEHDRWAAELRAETEKRISDRERALNLDLNAESALLRESVGRVAKACGEKIAVASGLREKLRELEASSREALAKNR
jgi:energy-coupling factor transporter ATP-binding protein EcfA2